MHVVACQCISTFNGRKVLFNATKLIRATWSGLCDISHPWQEANLYKLYYLVKLVTTYQNGVRKTFGEFIPKDPMSDPEFGWKLVSSWCPKKVGNRRFFCCCFFHTLATYYSQIHFWFQWRAMKRSVPMAMSARMASYVHNETVKVTVCVTQMNSGTH